MLVRALPAQRSPARAHRPARRDPGAAGARRLRRDHRRGLRRARQLRLSRSRICTCWRTTACATSATRLRPSQPRTKRRSPPGWPRSFASWSRCRAFSTPKRRSGPTRRWSASSPGIRPTEPRGNLLVKHIVRKGEPEPILRAVRGRAGRALQHGAPGARLHRDRSCAGRALARRHRRHGLLAEPEPVQRPQQPVPGAGARRGKRARDPAAGRRRVRRQGRPDLPDDGPGREAGAAHGPARCR